MSKRCLDIKFAALDESMDDDASLEERVDSAVCSVDWIRNQIGDAANLRFWPYESPLGPLSGGRSKTLLKTVRDLKTVVRRFARNQLPFSLPINGARLTMTDAEVDAEWGKRWSLARESLDCVAENIGGVGASVTVAHDRVLELVNRNYPGMLTVASCTRYLQGDLRDRLDGYRRDAACFDRFVPLNQDGKLEVLSRIRDLADRIILLVNSGCGKANIADCRAHYRDVEAVNSHNGGGLVSYNETQECHNGGLGLKIFEELGPIVGMGLGGVKFARSTGLPMSSVQSRFTVWALRDALKLASFATNE